MTQSANRPLRNLPLACLLAAIAVGPSPAQPTETPTTSAVLETIARIRSEPPSVAKSQEITALVIMVKRQDFMLVNEAEVDSLMAMLGDSDDWVRMGGAASLGELGRTARKAVPALKEALKQVDCGGVDFNSAGVIREAIRRIGVIPPPPPLSCGGATFSRDLIPDSGTAVKVGRAILQRYVGDKKFAEMTKGAPLRATLIDDAWSVVVDRRLTARRPQSGTTTGTANLSQPQLGVELSKRDAQVLKIFLGQ